MSPGDGCSALVSSRAVSGQPTRAEAEALLFEFTQSDALRKHARAVEVAMRAYAGWFGITDPAEVEKWAPLLRAARIPLREPPS